MVICGTYCTLSLTEHLLELVSMHVCMQARAHDQAESDVTGEALAHA